MNLKKKKKYTLKLSYMIYRYHFIFEHIDKYILYINENTIQSYLFKSMTEYMHFTYGNLKYI